MGTAHWDYRFGLCTGLLQHAICKELLAAISTDSAKQQYSHAILALPCSDGLNVGHSLERAGVEIVALVDQGRSERVRSFDVISCGGNLRRDIHDHQTGREARVHRVSFAQNDQTQACGSDLP